MSIIGGFGPCSVGYQVADVVAVGRRWGGIKLFEFIIVPTMVES